MLTSGRFHGHEHRPNVDMGAQHMMRVGKAKAGHLLDGQKWVREPQWGICA